MAEKEHDFVKLARETVEEYALTGKIKEVKEPIPPALKKKAGVFVSIKKEGKLRGCIGTIQPTEENIAREIISNAISAANRDPRFPPVRPDELSKLEYSVDILGEPEEIDSIEELDPQKYGVIVEKGYRRGLLLPDLEGIATAEEQVVIAKRKAGLSPEEEVKLYRFQVKRYK